MTTVPPLGNLVHARRPPRAMQSRSAPVAPSRLTEHSPDLVADQLRSTLVSSRIPVPRIDCARFDSCGEVNEGATQFVGQSAVLVDEFNRAFAGTRAGSFILGIEHSNDVRSHE